MCKVLNHGSISAEIKKEKPLKHVEKEKANMFVADCKSIKENIKIKEILRTVKMNSSMRIKAPRGSKVMQNKDFNDNDDFDEMTKEDDQYANSSSTDLHDNENKIVEVANKICVNNNEELNSDTLVVNTETEESVKQTVHEHSENENEDNVTNGPSNTINSYNNQIPEIKTTLLNEYSHLKSRERKLSLDQTMLMRRESLSQSEMDLNTIGKSPLERKSSFFRKKWESFKKNASESFKKQSLGGNQSKLQRHGSVSVSLQSLNEKTELDTYDCCSDINVNGSINSLQSSTIGQSTSSLSASQGERLSPLPGEDLPNSIPNCGLSTGSINCLNDTYANESLLTSRAISMSSGLDTAVKRRRRKTSLANRVTWLASETMANYLKRVIPDDAYANNKETPGPMCNSYQDLSYIPEKKTDSKGRRLSYQRAVSGEDPVLPSRYQESSMRRRQLIPEDSEADYELSNLLLEFTRNGVPPLKGFCITPIPDQALTYLYWAENASHLEEICELKKLPPNEEARQAVIRELIVTEADYIRHLMAIVEVFIAAAHALQDSGKLLDVDTERLFSNIPDVLNASLYFWEVTIYPMLLDAAEKSAPFNTEFMALGFCRFRELFQPYEKYVSEQTKALDYLRSLATNSEFTMYLTWCHSQKSCNRLQLSDIMVKPMQRLTKYSLILRRVIAHTDAEPERTSLIAMESFSKNYVLDLNRSIRQREELEKLEALANSIDAYEVDFKDDDIDKIFHQYAHLNLKAPMVNCLPSHSRTLIHQADFRFKDNINTKEIEVRVVLLTDMLLICKKQLSKNSTYPFKLIRPKYMVDRLLHFPKYKGKEMISLIFVMLDEVGSATHGFSLTEVTNKDPNAQGGLKLWEQKVKEAKLTYELGVWFARNPSRDLSEVEMDSSSDYALTGTGGTKPSSEDLNIEREARERVAAMLHRSMGASTEYDFSQASMTTDSFDGTSGPRSGAPSLRHPMHRNSTGGSSRNSRLSSFQQSTSAASHDEPQPGPSRQQEYRAGSSVEHLIHPFNNEDAVTSITVNVVSESESETVVPTPSPQPGSSKTPSKPASPSKPPSPSPNKLTLRSSSSSHNTLRVQPANNVMALVHSLPDLTIEPSPPRPPHASSVQSASEKLYQSHQELLHRNRLSASQHHQYLTPDHRGTSYPPPSPTRASLKRGLAFSYSFKNPPLSKMGHVNSQSQLPTEPQPSTSQQAKAQAEKGSTSPVAGPSGINSDKTDKKSDKKSKHVSSRHKGGGSLSPNRKDDKGD